MKNVFLFLGLIVLTLAACQDGESPQENLSVPPTEAAVSATEPAESTPQTEEPTEMPAEEAAEAPEEAPVEETAEAPTEAAATDAPPSLPAELTAQLDAFLASQVYSEGGNPEGAAPGLILLVETPDGRYLNAAGVSSLESGASMQVDDRLEIGSNSKSFTIAVLMQLQEEGLLSFDDLLSDWLPEFAAQIPNGEQGSLRQLAAHTSGIWDYGDPIIGEAANDPQKLELGYTPQELVQYAIDNGTPDFAPDEAWNYSNTGYILLGMIAEKAAGQPLGELYRERIFEPLGLETAALIPGVPEAGEITDGYWWNEDGTRLNTTNWNVSQGWAAGGNAMTAEELAAYGQALAAGELFQDPDSLAQMLAFNDMALFGGGAPFGLGLIDFGNGYWGHEGQTAGFQSLWYTNPEEEITVVVLTNSAAYSAYNFLNVINIVNGRGTQPFLPISLLPIGQQAPALTTSDWEWVQRVDGADVTEILPGTKISLASDGSASALSDVCGTAAGTFSADAQATITFDLDGSPVTCTGDEPLVELLDLLAAPANWRFDNGRLVITPAGEAGELLFRPPPPATEEPAEEPEEESADAAQPAPLPDEIVAQLDEFLLAQLYTEGMNPQSGAPGVILLVDRPDGRYLNAAGVASLEEGTPIQVDDRVEIGSNTKSFTIALLMQLQEEGVLSMDDPLSTWLPKWADLIPYGNEITLRQLAQHTSGIWDYGDPIIGEAAAHPVHLQDFYTPDELVQYAIDNGTPDFTPGEEGQWKYSNTGYILLGMVLEAATGEKLSDLYQTRIFDPLGLESAVFIEDVPAAHEIINGYWWTEDGHELNTTKWNVSQGWSAGGIAMNAEDLLTYGQALGAGELFQDPGSLEQMLAFDPDGMDGYMPAGLGLLDFSLVGAPGSWGHEGQTAGFQTLWFTNPQSGVTVVGLSNSAAYQGFNFLKVASIVSPEP